MTSVYRYQCACGDPSHPFSTFFFHRVFLLFSRTAVAQRSQSGCSARLPVQVPGGGSGVVVEVAEDAKLLQGHVSASCMLFMILMK